MSRGIVGKRGKSWVLSWCLNTRDFDLTCTNVEASEDCNRRLKFGSYLLLRAWIRLGPGTPTLSNLSRRPCECRLFWPWILHGVRKKGGGPIYNPGCKRQRLRLRSASRRNPICPCK